MSKLRKVENSDTLFNFDVKIRLIGLPPLEQAIDKYLKETLEQYFLKSGEKITDCYIDLVTTYHPNGKQESNK